MGNPSTASTDQENGAIQPKTVGMFDPCITTLSRSPPFQKNILDDFCLGCAQKCSAAQKDEHHERTSISEQVVFLGENSTCLKVMPQYCHVSTWPCRLLRWPYRSYSEASQSPGRQELAEDERKLFWNNLVASVQKSSTTLQRKNGKRAHFE